MVFVLCLREKQTNERNKQIKQSLDWLKDLSNLTVKTTFYLIKLKFSEAFGEKVIFSTYILRYNHYENFAKKPNFTLVSYGKFFIFLLIFMFTDFFPIFPVYNPRKYFPSFPGGIKGNGGKK